MARFQVKVGDVIVGAGELVLIAGPCAVESKEVAFRAAEAIVAASRQFQVQAIYKSSYMKANRLSGSSFSTIGTSKALTILDDVKAEFGLPILTDVHDTEAIPMVAEVADCLQIPAFLCRQTQLVTSAAETMLPINIKKGQFLAPQDMKPICEKVLSTGNKQVMLTERGTSFGYRDLVVDFRGLLIMSALGFPVVFDCSHSVQKPGASGGQSGGDIHFLIPLARAAVAVGVDAVFVETHPNPSTALSDRQCQLPTDQLPVLMEEIMSVRGASKAK